jgi:hypothetical protein
MRYNTPTVEMTERRNVMITDLLACEDCGFYLANGMPDDAQPGWSPDLIEAQWPAARWRLVNGDAEDDHAFSWQACDCCGSRLGGTRMAVHAIDMLEEPGGCGAGRRDTDRFNLSSNAALYLAFLDAGYTSNDACELADKAARNPDVLLEDIRLDTTRAITDLERPGGVGAQRLGIYWTARERQ